MRAKLGNHLVLVVTAALLATTSTARADFAQCPNPLPACSSTVTSCCTTTFPSASGYNPLIIPTDRCHQTPSGATNAAPGALSPRRQLNVSSWSRSGSVVTINTATAHLLTNNKDTEVVKLVGLSGITNGSYVVKTGAKCSGTCDADTFEVTASSGVSGTSGYVLAHNVGNGWCGDPPGSAVRVGGNTADSGMIKMYGLLYRLMQRSIPVYWLVNPSKSAPALTAAEAIAAQNYIATDVDAWVVTSDVTDPPDSVTSLTACGSGCTQPVHRLNDDLTTRTDSYQYKEFPMRGGAFLIAPADRAKFNEFWTRTGAYASLASQTKYNFTANGIDLYEIDATAKILHQNFAVGDGLAATSRYTTIVGAPVATKIDYEPPRVACIGCNSAVAQNWLDSAGLKDAADPASCATGEFVPSDATYCLINDYDIAQGTLVTGGFSWAWVFDYSDPSPCGNSAEIAVFDKLRDYLTTVPAVRNAGHSVFLDSSITTAEGCSNKQLVGLTGTLPTNKQSFDFSGTSAEPYIMRYPTNLFMQFGDIPYQFASGSVSGWSYYKSGAAYVGYQTPFTVSGSSLRRLMTVDTGTTCIEHSATGTCDVFGSAGDLFDTAVYARLGDVLANGLVFYLPGNQLDNNGNIGELRTLLNTLIAIPDESYATTTTDTEVARASPVIASIDGGEPNVYTGTYVRRFPIPNIPKATTTAGLARFTFPYIQGHMRAIPISQYSSCTGASCATDNTARTGYSAMTATFDAATGIPPVSTSGCTNNFNGSCRTVFTVFGTPSGNTTRFISSTVTYSPTYFTDTDANMTGTLGSLLSTNLTTAEKKTLVSRILKGYYNGSIYESKLGGVDRSTPAVIGPSPLAGSSGRPTMAYFGATDGMLHAVCAQINTTFGCDALGRELWAFIPRTLIPDFKNSTVRVDGSPHIIDAYGDFDGDGAKAWRTIMIITTGTGVMTNSKLVPAVYAIDITVPNSPIVLWEYAVSNVGARGSIEMGLALNVTAGQIVVGTTKKTLAFVQSTNGGTGGAGSVITALNFETGLPEWQFGDIYPTSSGASARSTAHEAAPSSGIPGGAVPVDKTGTGDVTHVVYGNLYGDVWVRSATTGASQTGSVPLLRISTDYHPIGVSPAIYKVSNTQYAAFATGGYADTQSTLWRGTNEATVPTQMVFSVNLDYSSGTSLTETSGGTNVPVKFNFTSSADGGFAQPVVVGTELFVVTDNTNVNSYDYGSYSNPTGKVYRVELSGTPVLETTMVIAGGAASLFNSATGLFSAAGAYGERLTSDADSTTSSSIDPHAYSTQTTRKLWLRTE